MPRRSALIAGLIFVACFGRTAEAVAQTPLTTCGLTVTSDAYLTGDLDCSATDKAAVILNGGTLDLGGFTLTGPADHNTAVFCQRSCGLIGPGTIVALTEYGVRDDYRATATIDGVTITGALVHGVWVKRLTLRSSAITDNQVGVVGEKKAVVEDSTFTGNRDGAWGRKLRVVDSTFTENYIGIVGRSAKVYGSTLTDNGAAGVHVSGGLRMESSTVLSNGTDPQCGVTIVCADITSTRRKPRLLSTACDYSAKLGKSDGSIVFPGDPLTAENDPATHRFGVCALD